MFKAYGLLGILMIIFAEINFFLKIEPFILLGFPIVWFGYIFTIDAFVYKIRRNSLIFNRFPQFLGMLIISAVFWLIFEFINIPVQNWNYIGLEKLGVYKDLITFISFSVVLPALFETAELIRAVHLFDKIKLRKKRKVSENFLHCMIALGVICFVLPIVFPKFTYPLIWASLFFLLDPINYIHKQPSIIGHIKNRNLTIPLSLLLAGIIIGILWEFWNYWAIIKWVYYIPSLGFFKIFEMPILGYLGYFPFTFELYAMYWFTRSLFLKKEWMLTE